MLRMLTQGSQTCSLTVILVYKLNAFWHVTTVAWETDDMCWARARSGFLQLTNTQVHSLVHNIIEQKILVVWDSVGPYHAKKENATAAVPG